MGPFCTQGVSRTKEWGELPLYTQVPRASVSGSAGSTDPTPSSKRLLSPQLELFSRVWLGAHSGSDSGKVVRAELALALAMAVVWLPASSSRTGSRNRDH